MLEQKKIDDSKVPKIDKNDCAKNMKNILLHLKLTGVSLAYVVLHHIEVAHILPRYGIKLNLYEEVIARAPIVKAQDESGKPG